MTLSYDDSYTPLVIGSVSKDIVAESSTLITMAQSSYFKINIDFLTNSVMSSHGANNILKGIGNFLPVKSMNFTPVSLETTTIPLGIFSDMSFITRRKVGKFNITIYDTNDNFYEKKLLEWYNLSVPNNRGYVGYMKDIVSNMLYVSYSTTGIVENTLNLEVMLAEDLNISRDYESNELKTITFSVIVVGTK